MDDAMLEATPKKKRRRKKKVFFSRRNLRRFVQEPPSRQPPSILLDDELHGCIFIHTFQFKEYTSVSHENAWNDFITLSKQKFTNDPKNYLFFKN